MAKDRYITLAGTQYRVALGLQEREDIEKEAEAPLPVCLTTPNTIRHQAITLWGAIKKHAPTLTPDNVRDLMQAHVDSGGNLDTVMSEVRFLTMESRVMGVYKPEFLAKLEAVLYSEPAAAITPQ